MNKIILHAGFSKDVLSITKLYNINKILKGELDEIKRQNKNL